MEGELQPVSPRVEQLRAQLRERPEREVLVEEVARRMLQMGFSEDYVNLFCNDPNETNPYLGVTLDVLVMDLSSDQFHGDNVDVVEMASIVIAQPWWSEAASVPSFASFFRGFFNRYDGVTQDAFRVLAILHTALIQHSQRG